MGNPSSPMAQKSRNSGTLRPENGFPRTLEALRIHIFVHVLLSADVGSRAELSQLLLSACVVVFIPHDACAVSGVVFMSSILVTTSLLLSPFHVWSCSGEAYDVMASVMDLHTVAPTLWDHIGWHCSSGPGVRSKGASTPRLAWQEVSACFLPVCQEALGP